MYNERPLRDKKGRIIFQAFKSKDTSHEARVEPNRRWFGPSRTVTSKELETFREELSKHQKQPYSVVIKSSKIPYSLLKDPVHEGKVSLLEVESFDSTFGQKSTRKRPRIDVNTMEELAKLSNERVEKYNEEKDRNIKVELDYRLEKKNRIFSKGQSARIWNELYKVVDSSDVVVQVLDARNPLGTRCYRVEKHIKENCPHKHMIILLNKCDLIPNWVTKRWLHIFSKEYPTLAFHASLTKSFGKGSLIQLLRQFQNILSNKQQISVGFVGYPNVGKSSIINTLRSQKVCNVAPIPGETKHWQYISLFKKIFLIDCPGVVYPSDDETETETVLKGVIRVENLKRPSEFIAPLLERAKKEYIQRTYDIMQWENAEDFLNQYAYHSGKLLKKGEPDIETVSKMMLNDWIRGKIPYFVPPPDINLDDDTKLKEKSKIQVPEQNINSLKIKENFFNNEELEKDMIIENGEDVEENGEDVEVDGEEVEEHRDGEDNEDGEDKVKGS
jgi:nuclear GTP-binding protein